MGRYTLLHLYLTEASNVGCEIRRPAVTESAQCFMSVHISLSQSTSQIVIPSDYREQGWCESPLVLHYNQSHRLERVVPTYAAAVVGSRFFVAAMFCPSDVALLFTTTP